MLNVDWNNDDLFFTYTFVDETSVWDPHPSVRWSGGYYSRNYKIRVPLGFKNSNELIEKFVEMMLMDYPDEICWVE